MTLSRRVQPGQRRRPASSAEFNSWQDAADDFKSRKYDGGLSAPEFDAEGAVLIKNDSGAAQSQFAILGINGFVITPTANLPQFKSRVALSAVKPIGRGFETGGELHTEDSFVVLAEPIKIGKIGHGWVHGTCPVQVNVISTSHRYAKIRDDDTSKLDSADNGPVVILWKESGTGTKWAVIRFGGSPIGTTRMRVKVVKPNYLECKTWDGTTEGSVTINVAKPYLHRSTLASYDGDTFSSYSSDGQLKLATQGATAETWELTSKYVVNAEIWAELGPIGGTGVVDSLGAPVLWIDTNKDGRFWAKVSSTPPQLEEGAVAGDLDEPFWIQGVGYLENPGAEIVCAAVVQDCGVLETDGATVVATAYASALAGAIGLSGPGGQVSGSGKSSAKAAPTISGPGAQTVGTGIASVIGSGALSGAGAMTVGYLC